MVVLGGCGDEVSGGITSVPGEGLKEELTLLTSQLIPPKDVIEPSTLMREYP